MARRKTRRWNTTGAVRPGGPASPLLGLRYPLLVAAIAAPLFAIYCYPYAPDGVMAASIESYLSWYARLVSTVISVIDPQVVVHGNRIVGRLFSMQIVQTCDAMEVYILLAAAIVGFPMPLRRRVIAVLVSVMSLVIINVLRLCVLYWLGAHVPSWFNRTHETLAPLFLVGCAVVSFLFATSGTGKPLPAARPR